VYLYIRNETKCNDRKKYVFIIINCFLFSGKQIKGAVLWNGASEGLCVPRDIGARSYIFTCTGTCGSDGRGGTGRVSRVVRGTKVRALL
jgi:hypothetical protein